MMGLAWDDDAHPVADPATARRVTESFARQTVMATLGMRLSGVRAGAVTIDLPYRSEICQQHGFIHAGVVATGLDSACGYAAYSLMPSDAGVLTIEFKINLIAPAAGELILFRGRVLKSGRTISFCEGEAIAAKGAERKRIATLSATVMTIAGREDVKG